jgi:hypothetical protein
MPATRAIVRARSVRRSGRLALQRLYNDAFHLGVVDLARHPSAAARRAARRGPRSTKLRRHLPTLCTVTPFARRYRLVAQARGTAQHDPRPQRQGLRRVASLPTAFHDARNLSRQFNPGYRATRSQPHPPYLYQFLSQPIMTRISGSGH